MLSITVLGEESFDEETSEFLIVGGFNLELEHSLLSLSKWEIIHEKPFLTPDEKSSEEIYSYLKAMALSPNVPDEVFRSLTTSHLKTINDYMNKKMTATWFNEPRGASRSPETITNELIYYWMDAFGIPENRETWHLNRLFTLLKVHSLKQQKPKPMSMSERIAEQRRINAKRRKELEEEIAKEREAS